MDRLQLQSRVFRAEVDTSTVPHAEELAPLWAGHEPPDAEPDDRRTPGVVWCWQVGAPCGAVLGYGLGGTRAEADDGLFAFALRLTAAAVLSDGDPLPPWPRPQPDRAGHALAALARAVWGESAVGRFAEPPHHMELGTYGASVEYDATELLILAGRFDLYAALGTRLPLPMGHETEECRCGCRRGMPAELVAT